MQDSDTTLTTIADLAAIDGRAPGRAGDKEAADRLIRSLEALGRQARIDPVKVRPYYPVVYAVHLILLIVGSALAIDNPAVGCAVVLIASVSMYGDLTGRFHLLRALFPPVGSQNITSPGDRVGRPGRLVLVAGYDTARTGLAFHESIAGPLRAIARRLPMSIGPFSAIFAASVAILAMVVLRMAGVDTVTATAIQYALTALLVIPIPFLLDIAFGDFVPGADTNASGVATVLRLAERFEGGAALASLDLWIVFTTASQDAALGMRRWLGRNRSTLRRVPTWFIDIDSVGAGDVRWLEADGPALLSRFDPAMQDLCHEAAAQTGARPYKSRLGSDGLLAQLAGYPAVTVRCLDAQGRIPRYRLPNDTAANVERHSLDAAFAFTCDLIERLDRSVGPREGESRPAGGRRTGRITLGS